MIGRTELALLPPGALVVVISRGGIVDEQALADALHRGSVVGAAVDTFEQEPPPPTCPLFGAPNFIATPHIAAGTRDALEEKMRAAFANMLRVARGEPPLHVVPPPLEQQR